MRDNKRAYVRTAESAIAFVILLLFVVFTINVHPPTKVVPDARPVLLELESIPSFRTCVAQQDIACLETTVSALLQENATVTINEERFVFPEKTDVLSDSVLIYTTDGVRVVRVYY